MTMMLIFMTLFCIVKRANLGADFICRMGSCCVLTSCAFQLVRFVFCCCRKLMEAASWVTSVSSKRMRCWPTTSFGLGCAVMLSILLHAVLRARKLNLVWVIMVCICPCLFPLRLGMIFQWILFWDCLALRRGGTVFLWWLIGSLKWITSYLVIKLMMHPWLLNCS